MQRTLAILLGAMAITSTSGSATALDLVGVTEVTLGWTAATGPVHHYGVFVRRNGAEASELPEQVVSGTTATVNAGFGDVIAVSVAGYDAAGARGPLSEASELLTFLAPPADPSEEPLPTADPAPVEDPEPLPAPEPDPVPMEDPAQDPEPADSEVSALLYSESFEGYRDGEDPLGWLDTGAQNSLAEAPALFEAMALTDGTTAFGTVSELTDIHSHLQLGNSVAWSDYEFAGELAIGHPRGGIGVTLYSDYPSSDTYYRLRRHGTKSFQLAPHADGRIPCHGRNDTGVVPQPDSWYRFRFQAYPDGAATHLRAKVWPKPEAEPVSWQIDCIDPTATFEAGAPGLWSKGRGTKLWDALEVNVIEENSPQADPLPDSEQADGPVLYVEGFEGYRAGEDPLGWVDTGPRSSLLEDPALFETLALRDGSMAFGTASRGSDIHSHLHIGDSVDWSAYEFSGLLAIDRAGSGIGVTLYSGFPRSGSYYRLGREHSRTFQLEPHGEDGGACLGRTDTGIVPQANVWYRFRFRARPEGSGTRLQAKVWAQDHLEPESWQVDCLDPDGTYQSGAPGLWSAGKGLKLWDELEVFAIPR